MKVSELIQKLQTFDENLEVSLVDMTVNMKYDEGSSEGVCSDFDVEVLESVEDEKFLSFTFESKNTEPVLVNE